MAASRGLSSEPWLSRRRASSTLPCSFSHSPQDRCVYRERGLQRRQGEQGSVGERLVRPATALGGAAAALGRTPELPLRCCTSGLPASNAPSARRGQHASEPMLAAPDLQPAAEERAHELLVALLHLHERPAVPQRVAHLALQAHTAGARRPATAAAVSGAHGKPAGRDKQRQHPPDAAATAQDEPRATGKEQQCCTPARGAHRERAGALSEPLACLLGAVHLRGQHRQALVEVGVGALAQRLDALQPQIARAASGHVAGRGEGARSRHSPRGSVWRAEPGAQCTEGPRALHATQQQAAHSPQEVALLLLQQAPAVPGRRVRGAGHDGGIVQPPRQADVAQLGRKVGPGRPDVRVGAACGRAGGVVLPSATCVGLRAGSHGPCQHSAPLGPSLCLGPFLPGTSSSARPAPPPPPLLPSEAGTRAHRWRCSPPRTAPAPRRTAAAAP